MKYYLITIFISLLNLNCYSQSNIDSIIKNNKVKEVRIYNVENQIVSLTKYNSKGLLEFTSSENFANSVFLKTSLTKIYNENNNLVKSINTHSSFSEPIIWFYEYDNRGNLSTIINEKNEIVFKYFYDKKSSKIKEVLYDNNKISQTTIYRNLDNGLKQVEVIKGDFIENRENVTYFDKNKNELKTESFDNGKLTFQAISEYDANKIKIKTTVKDNENVSGEIYTNNEKRQLIKRQLFEVNDGIEIKGSYETYDYFKNGLISFYSENIYLDSNLRKYWYEYEFYE